MVAGTSIISRLELARERGIAWLVEAQRPDGAIGDVERHGLGPVYKALWAYACAGQTAAANRLASWIKENLLTEDGDLAGPLRGRVHDRAYGYPHAWITVGAHKLGRYDISHRTIEFLLLLQHDTGGIRVERDREDAVQDVLNTGQAGNALLATGRVREARAAGQFLRTVWEAQPYPERELFFVYKPGEGLRTDFAEDRQRLHSIRIDQPRQSYFNSGMAAAFLARLAMATGDDAWAQLGRQYLEISFNVLDEMYETAQVGKVGWGAAAIHQITGDERLLALAERVGDAMIAQQQPNGAWDNTGGYVNEDIRAEVTAEFVVILDEMVGALSAPAR